MKTKKRYIGIGIVIGIILNGLFTIPYIFSQSGNTFIISEGIYPHGVSYTMWREGSIYYTKDAYGLLDYSANFTALWNSVINKANNGSTIFLREDTYSYSTTLTINKCVKVIGEGYGRFAGMVGNDNTFEGGTVLLNIGTGNSLNIIGDASLKLHGVQISNLRIEGSSNSEKGIYMLYAPFTKIDNVIVHNHGDNCLWLDTCFSSHITDSRFENSFTQDGIFLNRTNHWVTFERVSSVGHDGGDYTSGIVVNEYNNNVHVIDCGFDTEPYGVYVYKDSKQTVIRDCWFESISKNAININGLSDSIVDSVIISGNHIRYSQGYDIKLTKYCKNIAITENWLGTNYYGTNIYIDNTVDNVVIENNRLSETTPFEIVSGATNVDLKNNQGYVIINCGSLTGTGAQQTIAHGLGWGTGLTPNIVLLSPSTTNAYESASADNTNIYVTADNGEKYYWYVQYKP